MKAKALDTGDLDFELADTQVAVRFISLVCHCKKSGAELSNEIEKGLADRAVRPT